ncbi:MAG: Calx-beta domain-containing protein, partial [Desulfuromonadales bacterium]|nr:Calx-beta domain-containing protein [Desulfuromonadales bacterium]
MADETTSTQTETTATNTFVVPVPDPGQNITVLLDAQQIPQITFDPGTESTQEFVGNDLVFTLPGGAVLTFEDFAADVNNGDVTAIMLADGTVIPIEALMAAWNLEVPETAAGPAEAGGGSSQYADDMGDALAGINKLGVQDPDPLAAAAPQVQEDEQTPIELPPVVEVSIDDVTVTEPDVEETVTATFTVTLSQATTEDVTIDFTTADGTAISGGSGVAENDYGFTSGTVTIPAGSTSATIEVTVIGDNYFEGNEQFFVNLSNATGPAVIVDDQGVGTILDNDQPTVSISAVEGGAANEGNPVTFQVELDKPSDEDTLVTINVYTGQSDDATEDLDYDSSGGKDVQTYTVTIPAGYTSATFDVNTYEDTIYEVDETFSAQITSVSNPVGTILVDSTPATGTILDDDDQPVFSIDDVTVTEGVDA